MKLLIKIGLLLCLATAPATAQEFKLGKVSKAELQEKFHPADSSAPAAILYKRGKTYFEITSDRWFMVTEVEARIKIYKKEGYEYANQQLSYYTGGMSLKVFFNDVYTYNLVGDKIEKTKMRSDGEFEEVINENFSIKKIVLPNVKEGSVVEYRYIIKTPYFSELDDFYFQYSIPVNDIAYETAIPSYFSYNRYLAGYIPVEQSVPVTRKAVGANFDEVSVVYSAKNIKAIKNESYVNNIRNYMAILKHELASVKFPSSEPKYYSTDWEAVTKRIYEDKDFGKQLGEKSYYEEDLKALLTATMTPDQKMDAVFSYVKERMNWNEQNGYFTKKNIAKAYKEKVGNVAEINLMLTSMLRYAGLSANPVLISTRSNGIAMYPNLMAFNYVIAAVNTDKGFVLLDATSKYAQPDVIPVRTINWVGRVIRENGSNAEVSLMPKISSKEVINISAEMDAEGKFKGRARDQYFDYNALNFREAYNGLNKDSYIEKIEKHYKGLEIGDYTILNDKDLSKPVVEDFTFTHNNISDVIGDKIYFNPMLFFTQATNPFKEEIREYPIDFTYQHQDRYMINITLPKGYVVESLPKPVSYVMEENIGSFKYNIVSQNNQVQLNVAYDINYATISQDYYTTLRDFFRQMIEKQNEKIVLKRI